MEENMNPKLNNNQEYIEEDGIKLSRIIKVAVHRYVLLGIITLATCAVGTLSLTLVNKPKESYKVEFEYSIPSLVTDSENNKLKLADGSEFSYLQLISESNLRSIKANNQEKFKSVDIDKLLENSLTSITSKTTTSTDSKETIKSNKITYTLVLPKSIFSSSTQAKEFAKLVCETPITYNKNFYNNYNYYSYVDKCEACQYSYLQKLDYLTLQYEFLNDRYENLILAYGENASFTLDGKIESLASSYTTFKNETDVNKIAALKTTAISNHYSISSGEVEGKKVFPEKTEIKNELSGLEYRKTELTSLQTAYKEMLKDLPTSSTDYTEILEKLTKITEELVETTNKITDLENMYYSKETDDKSPADFVDPSIGEKDPVFCNQVTTTTVSIKASTERLKAIELELLNEKSLVNYSTSKVITLQNGVSMGKNIGLTLLGGFVLGCITNLILDRKYLKEEYPLKDKVIK